MHLALINVGGITECAYLKNMMKLEFLGITGLPIIPNWDILMGLPSLKKMTLLIDRDHVPAKNDVYQFAEKYKKNITKFEENGKSTQPLIHIEF